MTLIFVLVKSVHRTLGSKESFFNFIDIFCHTNVDVLSFLTMCNAPVLAPCLTMTYCGCSISLVEARN